MGNDATQKVILTRDDLKRMGIRVSNTSLLRWEARSRFPRRVGLAGTSVGWLAHEVSAWLQDRAAERARHDYAEY